MQFDCKEKWTGTTNGPERKEGEREKEREREKEGKKTRVIFN